MGTTLPGIPQALDVLRRDVEALRGVRTVLAAMEELVDGLNRRELDLRVRVRRYAEVIGEQALDVVQRQQLEAIDLDPSPIEGA